MVSGCTEVEGYKPKLILSSVTKKWFISLHVYIYMYVCMYFQTPYIMKTAICVHAISRKHKLIFFLKF